MGQELVILIELLERMWRNDDLFMFVMIVALSLCLLILPWALLKKAFNDKRRTRLMEALPTSKVKGVFIGLVELKGVVESPQPLTAYLSDEPSVWFQYSIQEHWRRVEVVTYVENGQVKQRPRITEGWTTVGVGGSMIPFFLRDETGALPVNPSGAQIDPETVVSLTCSVDHPLYYGKGPSAAIPFSTFKRRFVEESIRPGRKIYLIGPSRERSDVVAPEIAADGSSEFFISVRAEEDLQRSLKINHYLKAICGLLVGGGSFYLLRYIILDEQLGGEALLMKLSESFPMWGCFIFVYLLIWLIMWCWSSYNSLIDVRNRVKQGWSLIEVQLQRRFSLIPSLCQVVSAYMKHEHLTQEEIARIRSSVSQGADFRMLAEAYPNLKAEKVFTELSSQLVDTEDRIALARSYFNEIANNYNTRLAKFPELFLAKMFSFKPINLLETEAASRATPQIDWDDESSMTQDS